ncbi:hypothetical protein L7G72_01130 [Xenorhabdus bovienii]|uniref:hypothetical protein n=1 Tax=Xenorhabdus bovienii TaxID=40576 RepID=UPI001EDE8D11|nr:hypothetical protein [Xenorhabdus bovienii]MCG3460483.1 hypothetical protein [Xenorhabdus bovienii]
MGEIRWDLSGFNVFMESQYTTICDLEEDADSLYGSSNFSELDSLDWFLLNKSDNKLSFLLLSVSSSFFNNEPEFKLFNIEKLKKIELIDCIDNFFDKIVMQEKSYFSINKNLLIVSSDCLSACYKVKIADNFYVLLNPSHDYVGFLLTNAIESIAGYSSSNSSLFFNECLIRMLKLCTDEVYDAMDDQDEEYLLMLNELEKDCLREQDKDARFSEIIMFIKNAKFTFYDIAVD